jgi:hypothetical protein
LDSLPLLVGFDPNVLAHGLVADTGQESVCPWQPQVQEEKHGFPKLGHLRDVIDV